MDAIVVFGAGGHAQVVIDAIERQGRFAVAGLIADDVPQSLATYRKLGRPADLPGVLGDLRRGVVAIGENATRGAIVSQILEACSEFEFVTVTHPSAVVAQSAEVQAGSVILAGAVMNPRARLGRHCIINTCASVDHDCQIDDLASLAPGVTLGGEVTVGKRTAIGLGANVVHSIQIGADTVIGAGATVLSDVSDFVVAYGTPARVVKDRKPGDSYL